MSDNTVSDILDFSFDSLTISKEVHNCSVRGKSYLVETGIIRV